MHKNFIISLLIINFLILRIAKKHFKILFTRQQEKHLIKNLAIKINLIFENLFLLKFYKKVDKIN